MTSPTPKEKRFIARYLTHLNATQAAKEAGYAPKSAHVTASRLMVKLKKHIQPQQAEQLQSAKLDAETIKEEIRRLSTFDPRECFDAQGNLLHIKDMPPAARASIKSIEVMKRNLTAGDGLQDIVSKVQFWDKPASLGMAARHLKLLSDAVTVEHRFPLAGVPDDDLTAALEAALAKRRG